MTGGNHNVTGALQFNRANSLNNAANNPLTGDSSKIIDQSNANGLANFATNTGTFALAGGRNFTTAGNFTNNGTVRIGGGNGKFVVNGYLRNFNRVSHSLTGGTYYVKGREQLNGAKFSTTGADITLD